MSIVRKGKIPIFPETRRDLSPLTPFRVTKMMWRPEKRVMPEVSTVSEHSLPPVDGSLGHGSDLF